ncbi:MAG: GTPase [Nanoarchaeota archaeon]|nr:GTPase [Nanoarchaeota archaeon]
MKPRTIFSKDTNHEPYWDLIKRIITESDLVLEILDARLVELSRNEEVERLIEEIDRPVIYVLNKSDLVGKERLEKQIRELGDKKEIIFVSNKNKSSYKILLSKIERVFRKYGKREETIIKKGDPKIRHREAKADIVVGVLGYPNVGKSSIINGLAHKKKVKVSKKAGTTHGIHWIKINEEVKVIDSPGVIPLKRDAFVDDEIRYGLIGAKDNERIKFPEVVSNAIIKFFLKENKIGFERYYNIAISPEDIETNNSYEILRQVAQKKNFLIKGGELDEIRASQLIIRDWQEGRLRV